MMRRFPSLSISIVVKNPVNLDLFLDHNSKYFLQYPLLVVDSGGGESLERFSKFYLRKDVSIWKARRITIQECKTDLIFFLDSDVLIPEGYIEKACSHFLRNRNLGAVSILHSPIDHFGTLPFGVSIWRTEVIKELYDYFPRRVNRKLVKVDDNYYTTGKRYFCECLYMWNKLIQSGRDLETFNFKAIHLRRNKYGNRRDH